jgi:signal peptidase I
MEGETKTRGIQEWLLAIVIGRRPDRTLIRLGFLAGFAVVAFLIFSFVLYPVQITGPSMYPTYRNGHINFINRLAYLRHEPQRGDVVGIRFSGNHMMYVKRIVGMPGESIAFSGGAIYINGKKLDEPYLKFPSNDWESSPKQLGSNEYYVVGDNRSMPFEYHEKGATTRQRIIGKILLPSRS